MKQLYKCRRGRVRHVVHLTKTGFSRNEAWTICGMHFDDGERQNGTPTCPNCLKLDNPLLLSNAAQHYLEAVATNDRNMGTMVSNSRGRSELIQRDLLDQKDNITWRGDILADDYRLGPVPLADPQGVIHARYPLGNLPRCHNNKAFPMSFLWPEDGFTVARYAKLRALHENDAVTCFECMSLDH